MSLQLKRLFLSSLFAVISVCMLSCSKGKTESPQKQLPPEHGKIVQEYAKKIEESKKIVVAKVNGANITKSDLMMKMSQIAPKASGKDEEKKSPDAESKARKEALDILIFRELAFQEAVKQGMKPDAAAVSAMIEKVKKDSGSEKGYKERLAVLGLDEASLKKEIERNELIAEIIHKEVLEKANMNDKASIEKRKKDWEAQLKKKAKIEILNNQ